nr:MAG TPA: 6-phosphofructo-2-kinase [Caudoviricetes sp.]
MTGQEIVKSTISKWEQLPKFIIIEGQVGSGRKTYDWTRDCKIYHL